MEKQDEGGGEPTPDGTEEDSPEGEPSVAETDSGAGTGEDKVISTLPDSNKLIEKLVKAEIKKTLSVEKSKTPRPNQAVAGTDKMDAFEIAKGKPANFTEIREAARKAAKNEIEGILGA